MKMLITGASTILGSQVINRFKQFYPEVQISTIDDLSNYTVLKELFESENFDSVIHMASVTKQETAALLKAANKAWAGFQLYHRFFYVSSESTASNMALIRRYEDLTLVVSSCSPLTSSPEFPAEYHSLSDTNIKSGKSTPMYVNGQMVPEWFWVSDEACAIDVIFHQGEAGVVYNIGGVNSWKASDKKVSTPVRAYNNAHTEPILAKTYAAMILPIKNIFARFASE
jgi:dTDP-glucose 4,6-dehydratase